MPSEEQTSVSATARPTTQVHEIYINAPIGSVWDAVTNPEWNARYGYRGAMSYDLRPGGAFRAQANPQMLAMGLPDTIIDGEVLECVPPTRLVQTYRWLFNEQNKAEGFTRLTWELEATEGGFTRLTVTHELQGAPVMAAAVASRFNRRGGGGWTWILSDLKSLLETGKPMTA